MFQNMCIWEQQQQIKLRLRIMLSEEEIKKIQFRTYHLIQLSYIKQPFHQLFCMTMKNINCKYYKTKCYRKYSLFNVLKINK
jgi:hypothetical protein